MVRSLYSIMTWPLDMGCPGRGMTLVKMAHCSWGIPWRGWQLMPLDWQTPRSWGNRSFISGDLGGVSQCPHVNITSTSVLAAQEPSMQNILIITECFFHLLGQISFYESWQIPQNPMSAEDLFEGFLHIFSLVWENVPFWEHSTFKSLALSSFSHLSFRFQRKKVPFSFLRLISFLYL